MIIDYARIAAAILADPKAVSVLSNLKMADLHIRIWHMVAEIAGTE